jgi:hypothetical protein
MRKLVLGTLAALVLTAVPAQALVITPSSGVLNTTRWEGPAGQTGQSAIDAFIAGILGLSVELYKSDVRESDGGSIESGLLTGSYDTTFSPLPPPGENADPTGATIVYTGGLAVGPTAYLLVKDGNAAPPWYLFNLTALGWNGTATLELQSFWPQQGAISHVTLYGSTASVPEPGLLALMGLGLTGIGFSLRRRSA